jgi:hydrogenase maturation protease
MNDGWQEIGGGRPASIAVHGVEIMPGSRVQVMPRAGRDIFDMALAGRRATVESLELDTEGATHVVVTIDDDPARDFRDLQMPGHRFFFGSDEVIPVGDATTAAVAPRVLVAGIGNIFLGDDGFGVAVAQALLERPRTPGVDVVEYGIRGMDLAYALGKYAAAILIDAAPRGTAPGTLAVIDPSEIAFAPSIDTHGMDPVKVLGLARDLGPLPARLYVLVCEPERIGDLEDVTVGLTAVVTESVGKAVRLVESLIANLVLEVGCD